MDNHFTHPAAAARYAQSRPNVHPQIIRHIADRLGHVHLALDVACGTGRSSVTLRGVAARVVGVDPSEGMLRQITGAIDRVRGKAEALPFRDAVFDLLSVGLAFHWFNSSAFFAEARRVLSSRGQLLIYNSMFSGEIEGAPGFHDWWRAEYLTRYPPPSRNSYRPAEEAAAVAGFRLREPFALTIRMPMSASALVAYLTTQSNVIASVEGGRESLADATGWLEAAVQPLFEREVGTALFNSSGWLFDVYAAG